MDLPPAPRGREQEWSALWGALEEARAHRGLRAVLVEGPSGSGKTQLVTAFEDAATAEGMRVDRVRFDRLAQLPSHGLNVLLRSRLRLSPALDGENLFAALAAKLGAQQLALEFFAFILGAARDNFQTATLDTAGRWEGAFAELHRWLESEAGEQPWIWILEGAGAGDAETLRFLHWVAKARWEVPALLVLTARPEQLPAGSPWNSMVQAWRIEGALTAIRLTSPAGPALPGAGRFDPGGSALPPAAAALLRKGALMGDSFTASALGTDAAALSPLVAGRWVEPTPSWVFAGETEFSFREGAREAALAPLSAQERTAGLVDLAQWAVVTLESRPSWARLAPVLVPLICRSLEAQGDLRQASLWRELLGSLHLQHQRVAEASVALRDALTGADGVRQLVLLRRVADEELFAGEVKKAIATLGATPIRPPGAAASSLRPLPWFDRVHRDPLDRWEDLTLAEAALSAELVRAEALSQLADTDGTRAAFVGLQARIERLAPPWRVLFMVRWAKTWSWFLAELVGNPKEAQRVLDGTRRSLSAADLDDPGVQAAMLRAEEIVASRQGDYDAARVFNEQQLKLAQDHRDLRDEAIAWNAKGILHMATAEFPKARTAFEHSVRVSRTIGYRRREAIALHNLGLLLCELGEWEDSKRVQADYMGISAAIGNLAARAYGPASLAAVAIAESDGARAEQLLTQARRSAEENGWPFLLAWTRALAGRARLAKWVTAKDSLLLGQARNDFDACLDLLEDRTVSWTEELDPGEQYALLAACHLLSGRQPEAARVLERAHKNFPTTAATSRAWLSLATAWVAHAPAATALAWFQAVGHRRAVGVAEPICRALSGDGA